MAKTHWYTTFGRHAGIVLGNKKYMESLPRHFVRAANQTS